MCDLFLYRMEKNYQGDLADIVHATATAAPSAADLPIPDWRLPAEPLCLPETADAPYEEFGNPYGFLHDPLLPELPDSAFFEAPDVAVAAGGLVEEMKSTRPCNIFSSGVPTSSPLSPRTVEPMTIIAGPTSCIADDDGVQISSSRAPGIKRRKGQAKKVVCIPAPAAASSSRASGEVVPSDLWAWRKYGQKPIKGSPYPRGYYRCSSSKGCSARKQVERSRTDPSMLVITYTSEHNHPWPTQRNALAGSTRSQHPRNSSSASKNSPKGKKSPTNSKDTEEKETLASSTISSIKEEAQEAVEKAIDVMEDGEFNQIFHQSYKPITSESMQSDDFFADLAELDPDPMGLIFSKGMLGDKLHGERENKALDGLNYFDWSNNSF